MESGSGATQRQCPYFAKEKSIVQNHVEFDASSYITLSVVCTKDFEATFEFK